MDEKINNIIKNSIMKSKVTGKPLKFTRYFTVQNKKLYNVILSFL